MSMSKTKISLRAQIFAILVIAFVFVVLVVMSSCASAAELDAVVVPIEKSIPDEAPLTVVVVLQCNLAIGVYATMHDGSMRAFDMSSPVDWSAQVEWAMKANRYIAVNAPCHALPEDLLGTPKRGT
jgi:hypothetical protein